jgi:hypothetical protein
MDDEFFMPESDDEDKKILNKISIKEYRKTYNETIIKEFWKDIFRDINSRVLPIGEKIPEGFELLYSLSNNGNNQVNTLNNYGAVTYPQYLYQKVSSNNIKPRLKKDNKLKLDNFIDFTMLYIDEISICRKSMLDHLHMIEYTDDIIIDSHIFNGLPLVCDNVMSRPNYAQRRLKAFFAYKNRLDLLDVVSEMENTFIVGSTNLYALDSSQTLQNFVGSDIDICIDCKQEEFYPKVIYLAKDEKIEKKNDKSYKFGNIDIFCSPIGTIAGYHVPMVRSAYDGKKFIILPSLILAIVSKTMFEYRWVKTNGGVLDILQKYKRRGYEQILSTYELEIIGLKQNREVSYEFYTYKCKPSSMNIIDCIADLMVVSNVDKYIANIYINGHKCELYPGEMYVTSIHSFDIKRQLSGKNESLSTLWYGKYYCNNYINSDYGLKVDKLFDCIYHYRNIRSVQYMYLLLIIVGNESNEKTIYHKNFERIDGKYLKTLRSSNAEYMIIYNNKILVSSHNDTERNSRNIDFDCSDFEKNVLCI